MKKFIKPILYILLLLIIFYFIPKKQKPLLKPQEPKLEKIVFMLPFIQNINWSAYYCAQANGYFKEEGLEVELQYSSKGNAGPIEQLAGGNADIILTDTESIIKANNKGLNLVAVYLAGPTNVFYIVSEKGKNITKPADLVNKKIGVLSSASGNYTNLLIILSQAKIDVKDVDIIQTGLAMVPTFIEKKIDAAVVYLNEKLQIESKGIILNVINASDYSGVTVQQITVTENIIKTKPEMIKKFLRAYEKGLRFAVDNPEKALEIYQNINKDAQSQKEADKNLWETFIEKQHYKEKISGTQTLEMWQKSQDLLFDAGIIEKKTDVSKMFTNEFVPQ